jgi:N utilization substance protein A
MGDLRSCKIPSLRGGSGDRKIRRKNMARRNKSKNEELGPDSAGQAGDTQEISDTASADSESVEELAEEGNAFEADAVDGVENAKDPDVSEVRTREVPEDDVPEEYLDNDEHVA